VSGQRPRPRRRATPPRQAPPRQAPHRHAPPNPAGAHLLADHLAARLVRDAAVDPADLVFDLGAGFGALTLPLARTGARVVAVERQPWVARALAARTARYPNVTVVTGDAMEVPLPRRPFRVVANIPFAITTGLLRRLVASRMAAADLVVEAGAARRLTADADRRELAAWHRRFEFTVAGVIPARCFRPPPRVDAAILRLRRRTAGPSHRHTGPQREA
jgi:23S rRNA (adenine-N6)-dimethyltransferase